MFIDPKTTAKMKFLASKENAQKNFKKLFDEELSKWLTEEIRLNKARAFVHVALQVIICGYTFNVFSVSR